MQIIPATGRRLARNLGVSNFSTDRLTDPELNIKLGTYHFSRLIEQFGGAHYALASYNAGENRVVRWKAERPGLDEDEFIDDIPFPETQNYVKRILGTAEDYRILYGNGEVTPKRIVSRTRDQRDPGGKEAGRQEGAGKETCHKEACRKEACGKEACRERSLPQRSPSPGAPPAARGTTRSRTATSAGRRPAAEGAC